jgi:hypothetical protein
MNSLKNESLFVEVLPQIGDFSSSRRIRSQANRPPAESDGSLVADFI